MKTESAASRLVYSTEGGRICSACRQPVGACQCRPAARPSGDGTVRVLRQSKGRGGKVVTLVQGLPLDDVGLAALGKQLRAACGAGGTVKDGTLEVQGDHGERLAGELEKAGYVVKRVGA